MSEEEMQAQPSPYGWEVVTSYQKRPIKKRALAHKMLSWLTAKPKKTDKERADANRLQA